MTVNGGVKNWTTGQVLDADDLNNFVANQTIARFATISARTAAYGISGAPSLQKGLFSWVDSTKKLYYYDGTEWVEVGAQVEDGEITEAKLADSSVTSAKIVDGTIVNADINASAAIAHTKLANITAGSVLMGNSSNAPTATALSGDVTVNSSGVTAIGSGVVVNADISASASIALSKLASGTSGQIIVANTSGVPTWVSETGDVTISDTGVTAIASGVIVDADVNASAAIAHSKLANITAGSVLIGNASNVPTATALSGDVTVTSSGVTAIGSGVIVNADVNASAAIALSKLATSTSSQLASIISDETGSGALVFGTAPTITPAEGTTTNAHNSAGYMGMPQVSLSVGRTLNATDAGKHIYVTAGSQTITIPANTATAFPIGTTIVVVTANGISTSIAINTDTLRLANSSSTGTRTVASNGMATLLKINTTEWICSGNGVT